MYALIEGLALLGEAYDWMIATGFVPDKTDVAINAPYQCPRAFTRSTLAVALVYLYGIGVDGVVAAMCRKRSSERMHEQASVAGREKPRNMLSDALISIHCSDGE